MKREFKKLNWAKAKIFDIQNRKGYGCLCLNNLTEGKTPLEAYLRMQKAVKRNGFCLPDIDAGSAKKLLTKV